MPVGKFDQAKVFVSYSHKDSDWLEKLGPHLRSLEKQWPLVVWHDRKIQPGEKWQSEIHEALQAANVAVLLISADFIASDFISDEELPALLKAAQEKGVVLLPVILSPCGYDQNEFLRNLQSVNPLDKPLINLSPGEQHHYFDLLCRKILDVIRPDESKTQRVETGKRPRIINFPFRQNPYFTGRNNILDQLHEGFQSGDTAQALFGLGGVGKTQTAAQYAYKFKKEYQNILWVTAQAEETLISDYVRIAVTLELQEGQSKDQQEAIEAVKRWIEKHDEWLLVMDHVEDQDLIRKYLPRSYDGRMLLTARRQVNTDDVTSKRIMAMSSEEGTLFILRKLRQLNLKEPLSAAEPSMRAKAEKLCDILAGLPLALEQAAAYIRHDDLDIDEYIYRYNSEKEHFLIGDGAGIFNEIAVTFQMSFNKVKQEHPAAANILQLSAFLDGDEIPEEIFLQNPDALGDAFGKLTEDKKKTELGKAIGAGARYSLLSRDKEKKVNSINRLVQEVIALQLSDVERRFWAEQAVRAVCNAFLPPEFENWESCDRLIRHAFVLARVIGENHITIPDAAKLLERSGAYLMALGRYKDAESFNIHSLQIFQDRSEGESQEVVPVLNRLSILNRLKGRYDLADEYLRRSMEIYEKGPAPEDKQTVQMLNSRAQLNILLARIGEAESLYERSLKILENMIGADSPETGYILNNLGDVYHRQNKPERAEKAYLESQRLLEKHLDANNPAIANVLCNLAKHYRGLGRYDEAEDLYLRSISIYKNAFGDDDHPTLAIVLSNLAILYQNKGKYIQAERMYHKAVEIHEKAGTTGALGYAILLEQMGSMYWQLGRLNEAEPIYKRSLGVIENSLDAAHPDLVRIKNAYYSILADQGKQTT
jgi:tetratricopeptide (TPR) repeat protein